MEPVERILHDFRTIAVVGLSRDPRKAAYTVPAVLKAAGFRVVPVNPYAQQILGETAYPTLAAVPEPIEVVLVFRPAGEAETIARDAVRVGARALWLQLGLTSPAARRVAAEAGLLYVEDRCIAVERALHKVKKRR